jgi:DNA polymerase elongation subunit (family B)
LVVFDKRDAGTPEGEVLAGKLKILSNSLYGMLGSYHGMISSRPCAACITCVARALVRTMVLCSSELGAKVVYGDTDSIFAVAPEGRDPMQVADEVVQKFKNLLAGGPLSAIDVKVERVMKKLILIANKCYAYMNTDGTIEYKGVLAVKKNVPKLVTEFQMRFIDRVLRSTETLNLNSVSSNINDAVASISGKISLLNPWDMVKTQKVDMMWCYCYDEEGTEDKVIVPIEAVDWDKVRVSKAWLSERMKKSVLPVREVCIL